MVLLENSELLKARNNILDTVFADDMQDLNEVVEQLENNEEIKDKALITINWNEDELKDHTEDEIAYIQKFRDFYQSMFSEYQLRALGLVAESSKELQDDENLTADEKCAKIEGLLQNKAFNLLVSMFIKCGNFGARTANEEWNTRMEEIENLYMQSRNDLLDAHTKISQLEAENERLKNKKFLGIFKVN